MDTGHPRLVLCAGLTFFVGEEKEIDDLFFVVSWEGGKEEERRKGGR